jgi:hypothetical protein
MKTMVLVAVALALLPGAAAQQNELGARCGPAGRSPFRPERPCRAT